MADVTFGELYKGKTILEANLLKAVDAYMTNPDAVQQPIGDGFTVDMVAAIQASPYATGMLADPGIKDASKRSAVRTAILPARPVKA